MGDDDEEEPKMRVDTYEGDRAAPSEALAHTLGKRHGKGVATFPNGDVFEGTYVEGVRSGPGKYYFGGKEQPKATYEGMYEANKKCGQGTMVYPDGTKVRLSPR
jgi:radial spoke head protein 1